MGNSKYGAPVPCSLCDDNISQVSRDGGSRGEGGVKCNKILLKNNIYSAPVQPRPPCGDNNTQIKTTNCSLSVYRGLCKDVIQAGAGSRVLVSSCLMLDY